jgi:hypothetical protein
VLNHYHGGLSKQYVLIHHSLCISDKASIVFWKKAKQLFLDVQKTTFFVQEAVPLVSTGREESQAMLASCTIQTGHADYPPLIFPLLGTAIQEDNCYKVVVLLE